MNQKAWPWLALGAALLVGVALEWGCEQRKAAGANARADSAVAAAGQLEQRAAGLEALARVQADSLRVRDSLEAARLAAIPATQLPLPAPIPPAGTTEPGLRQYWQHRALQAESAGLAIAGERDSALAVARDLAADFAGARRRLGALGDSLGQLRAGLAGLRDSLALVRVDLARAQRGCRVLGIRCPVLGPGLGISGDAKGAKAGATIAVIIPIGGGS